MDEKLQATVDSFKKGEASVVSVLQAVQEVYRYLPREVLEELSAATAVPLSTLYSLATFYTSFRLEPMGTHHVCVCMGTACHVQGAPKVLESVERELGIHSGETTPDGEVTLDTVNCLGACALAPLVVVDDEFHGKMDQKKVIGLVKKLAKGGGGSGENGGGDG